MLEVFPRTAFEIGRLAFIASIAFDLKPLRRYLNLIMFIFGIFDLRLEEDW